MDRRLWFKLLQHKLYSKIWLVQSLKNAHGNVLYTHASKIMLVTLYNKVPFFLHEFIILVNVN